MWHQQFKVFNAEGSLYFKDVPFQVRKIAVKDAYAARTAALKLLKNKKITHFKLRFKSRKNPRQSVFIPKPAVSAKGIYHTMLGTLKWKETFTDGFKDARMVQQGEDFYLTLPYTTKKAVCENQAHSLVSVDLGVRTFATYYSPYEIGKIGSGAANIIVKLCLRLDKVLSEATKSNHNRKHRLLKVANRLRNKIRNKIDEMHKKTAKFLTDKFDYIILPTFDVSKMVLRCRRNIHSKSVRSMLSFGFYKFREYLRHRCEEHGKVMIEPSEAYTSKTQSWDGEVVANLGGAKWIGKGDSKMDRDYNGARGIFIKGVQELHARLSSLVGEQQLIRC